MISKYQALFANLRTDKNRNRYPTVTTHRAPHKPMLLLSVMDLIAQGRISANFIEPSFELAETFNAYYSRIMPSESRFPRLALSAVQKGGLMGGLHEGHEGPRRIGKAGDGKARRGG